MLSVIPLAVVCLAYFVMACVVLLNNPKAVLNRVFGALLITILSWNLVVFFEDVVDAHSSVEMLVRLDYGLAASMLGLFYWFCMLLSKKRWRAASWIVTLLAISSVVFALLGFVTTADFEGANLVLRPDIGFPAFILLLVVVLVASIMSLILGHAKTRGIERSQIGLVGTGLILTAVGMVLTLVVVPRIFGVSDAAVTRAGIFSTLIFSGFGAYAVVRHHFLDIRAAIARTLAYIMTLSFLAMVYTFIVYFVSSLVLGTPDIERETLITYLLLALALAFSFQTVKRFFDRFSDKVFFRDAYDPQDFLNKLNKVLVSTIETEVLLSRSAALIGQAIKSEFCVFVIDTVEGETQRMIGDANKLDVEGVARMNEYIPKKFSGLLVTDDLTDEHVHMREWLQANNIGVVGRIKAVSGSKGGGYFVMGAKKSGNLYTQQDIRTLSIVINELTIAIHNVLRFEEIEHFNRTLQEKIDEATKALRHANARLRKLDHTKDDFISMASHQLRTPLTSVKGYVSMVLDGDGGNINETQRKLLTQSFLGAQRMVYLISDLLNVSRLKTGKFIIEPIHSSLDRVIEEELNQLTETIKGRGLELIYNKPEVFPELMLDETKIRQVIMNFVDNAIYYTPNGGHITVNLVETPESIDFTVVDDGIGVPKHEQHHLFGKFYRAHNAKSARPDGTGLGLFMAKKVIIAQGGAIIFKSTEGKGSTFGFTFPKAKLLPKDASDIEPTTKLSS